MQFACIGNTAAINEEVDVTISLVSLDWLASFSALEIWIDLDTKLLKLIYIN